VPFILGHPEDQKINIPQNRVITTSKPSDGRRKLIADIARNYSINLVIIDRRR